MIVKHVGFSTKGQYMITEEMVADYGRWLATALTEAETAAVRRARRLVGRWAPGLLQPVIRAKRHKIHKHIHSKHHYKFVADVLVGMLSRGELRLEGV